MTTRNRVQIIEFFGLPGAGKSTLAKELVRANPSVFVAAQELMADDTSNVLRRARKLRLLLSGNLGPNERGLVRRALRVRQPSFWDKGRSVFPLMTYLSLCQRLKAQQQSAVFDHGLLQSAYSLAFRAKERDELGEVMSQMTDWAVGSGHLHVIVDTNPEVCRSRVQGRRSNHSRLRSSDEQDWQRSEQLFRDIRTSLTSSYAEKQTLSRMIVVDGNGSIEDVLRSIESWVSSLEED